MLMVQIAGKEVNLEFMSESIQSNDAMYSSANDLLKYLSVNIRSLNLKISDYIQVTHSIRYPLSQ